MLPPTGHQQWLTPTSDKLNVDISQKIGINHITLSLFCVYRSEVYLLINGGDGGKIISSVSMCLIKLFLVSGWYCFPSAIFINHNYRNGGIDESANDVILSAKTRHNPEYTTRGRKRPASHQNPHHFLITSSSVASNSPVSAAQSGLHMEVVFYLDWSLKQLGYFFPSQRHNVENTTTHVEWSAKATVQSVFSWQAELLQVSVRFDQLSAHNKLKWRHFSVWWCTFMYMFVPAAPHC